MLIIACRPEEEPAPEEEVEPEPEVVQEEPVDSEEPPPPAAEVPEVVLEVNRTLERYARNFPFASRRVSTPRHPVLGELSRPAQLFFPESAIYLQLAEPRFWNDFNFDDFGLEPPPAAPFRSVVIGELSAIGSQRYEVFLELEGFEETDLLNIVLSYSEDELTILIMRFI